MDLIHVTGAHKVYGPTTALRDVSITVNEGDCLALIGESGSGKTTLLRTVNGLTVLDKGRVTVRGRALGDWDAIELRRSIGYVQQDGGLIPHWTASRNAALVPTLLGRSDPEGSASAALEAVGLPPGHFAGRYPKELSGGQRQRVAIARAMAAKPDILLMDEPFGALDAITRADVQDTFGAVQEATGVTTILVTHDLREALSLATRIAVMKEGEIVDAGRPEAIQASPRPYVRELLRKAGIS
ncbi:MAG: ATP-binding cassette domain-containing protein [Gemmatimonadetes bacterium]|nr:ATP-binding cassette domain-containing protein [Gemmatimonadota bacterium]